MTIHILTTEQVYEHLKKLNGGVAPNGCSYRTLNHRASKGDIPKGIIIEKKNGNRTNLWAVSDIENLKNLML